MQKLARSRDVPEAVVFVVENELPVVEGLYLHPGAEGSPLVGSILVNGMEAGTGIFVKDGALIADGHHEGAAQRVGLNIAGKARNARTRREGYPLHGKGPRIEAVEDRVKVIVGQDEVAVVVRSDGLDRPPAQF